MTDRRKVGLDSIELIVLGLFGALIVVLAIPLFSGVEDAAHHYSEHQHSKDLHPEGSAHHHP